METSYNKTINNHKIACVFTDAGKKDIVIFCHGFRGSSVGPARSFVRFARKLSGLGISSLRFDQYGCGNSEGDFIDSSFNDWVETTSEVVRNYQKKGYRVALFGQSMGGSTAIIVGAMSADVASVVAWVPAVQAKTFKPPKSGLFEEGGQIVKSEFWQESHDIQIINYLKKLELPLYIVQCSEDEYITKQDHKAINENVKGHHKIEMYKGYSHSSWSYKETNQIINKSVDFIAKSFS